MTSSLGYSVFGAIGIISAIMLLVARDARRRDKLDGVDIGWAASILGCTWWYAALKFSSNNSSFSLHALLALFMISAWAVRIIYHLYTDRLRKPDEDGRYRELKAGWGANVARNTKIFFVAQGFIAIVFSTVPYAALTAGSNSLSLALLALTVFFVGLLGESLADRQLAKFRANPANKGKVCKVGLWKYSRHPNYFFDWVMWMSYIPLAGSLWWLALVAPMLLLYLFIFVTGIPPTEAQSLRSRGDAYREYQRTTSAFFPLPTKIGKHS